MRFQGLPAALLLVAGLFSSEAAAQPADAVLLDGRIVTLDDRSTVAQALAVRGNRIAAVGTTDEIRKLAGERTTVVELGGRTVIPGLIDSHIHAIRAGLTHSTEVSWIGVPSLAAALDRIAEAARRTAPGDWIIVAGGWTVQQFAERRRPTQADLVTAAPQNPVYVQMSYVAALLTPMGLAELGIAQDADAPPRGALERDRDGRPNGWINGDIDTIVRLFGRLPKPPLEQAIEGTKSFFRELNRFGLTGISDPGGHNLAPEEYEALFRIWREGGLTLRVRFSICAPRAGTELSDFQMLTRFLPTGFGDERLRFNGIGECVTWGMYNNDNPSPSQKAQFEEVARWAAGQRLTLTVHWNNDKSAHHLLDVLERVNQDIPLAPLRWSIAHLHDATPVTLRRMKAVGVGWLMQDRLYFAAPAFLLAEGDKVRTIPPIVTGLRMGLPIGGGTDATRVMSYNPFVALQWMLDGRTVAGAPTRDPAEIPTREEALRIYTEGSAWFSHEERERGRLQPSTKADLAVLTGDYLGVPVDQIGGLESVLTMVDGHIVYAAEPFAGLDPEHGR